ncbi:MAG: DUF3429 domain-containing protein [Hyphomonadaceae bacterium]|jgi:hypothetical protein|nr:DUF3429 domain-containing protein [Hyphomonadaceae bacterium]
MTETFQTPESLTAPPLPGRKGAWLKVWAIGLSGLTPFAVCFAGVILAGPDWDRRFVAAMVIYGALVATFSAGVRWGAEIVRTMPGAPDPGRLARSAPPLVAGLLAVLLLEVSWQAAVGVIIATGLGLLVWDLMAVRARLLPGWMAAFRIVAASGAIGLMLATAWTVAATPNIQPASLPAVAEARPATDPR